MKSEDNIKKPDGLDAKSEDLINPVNPALKVKNLIIPLKMVFAEEIPQKIDISLEKKDGEKPSEKSDKGK